MRCDGPPAWATKAAEAGGRAAADQPRRKWAWPDISLCGVYLALAAAPYSGPCSKAVWGTAKPSRIPRVGRANVEQVCAPAGGPPSPAGAAPGWPVSSRLHRIAGRAGAHFRSESGANRLPATRPLLPGDDFVYPRSSTRYSQGQRGAVSHDARGRPGYDLFSAGKAAMPTPCPSWTGAVLARRTPAVHRLHGQGNIGTPANPRAFPTDCGKSAPDCTGAMFRQSGRVLVHPMGGRRQILPPPKGANCISQALRR